MEKLKCSLKSLHEAISSMKPIGPICIQEAKTQSFREADVCSSLHYFSCPASSASYSSALSKLDEAAACRQPSLGMFLPFLEEDSVSCETSTMSSFSPISEEIEEPDDLPKDLQVSSKRFFFSPRTSKFIMEEAKPLAYASCAPAKDASPLASARASFHEESSTVTMASEDPYYDFRASMEEMVAAHEMRDWHCLQELLHCYLRLNDAKNHKVIVLAFVDLLMHLMSQAGEGFSSSCMPPYLKPK